MKLSLQGNLAQKNIGTSILWRHVHMMVFSLFMNCVFLSTGYITSEGINKNNSFAMRWITTFGNGVLWVLKNAISANGNNDEIFSNTFDEGQKMRTWLFHLSSGSGQMIAFRISIAFQLHFYKEALFLALLYTEKRCYLSHAWFIGKS